MTNKGKQGTVASSFRAQPTAETNRRFAVGLIRALGGAVLFSFPMLMTMEMWALGFYVDPLRLALFIALAIPLLFALSYYSGFEATSNRLAEALDALSAYAIGFVASALLLSIFGLIGPAMSADEIIGKIAIQAVPASIGALFSRGQLSDDQSPEERERSDRYGGGLFLMAVGALFLSLGLASTEEIMVISYKMAPSQAILLMLASLIMKHGFVHAVVAKGRTPLPRNTIPFWTVFLRFTIVGYAIALLISLFMLWTFGRTDGLNAGQVVQAMIVLGFPAALGAGAARLII